MAQEQLLEIRFDIGQTVYRLEDALDGCPIIGSQFRGAVPAQKPPELVRPVTIDKPCRLMRESTWLPRIIPVGRGRSEK